MSPEGADERRIRHLLRNRGVGPDAEPPTVEEQPDIAGREPDWLDELVFADEPGEQPTQEPHTPWYAVRKQPDPEPSVEAAPGVHITINQRPQQPGRADYRRARARRFLAYHGTAAGAGWTIGLGPAMADYLTNAGQSAVPAGLGLVSVALIFDRYLAHQPAVPPGLRPALVWLLRVPASTAGLALALHAPGTVV